MLSELLYEVRRVRGLNNVTLPEDPRMLRINTNLRNIWKVEANLEEVSNDNAGIYSITGNVLCVCVCLGILAFLSIIFHFRLCSNQVRCTRYAQHEDKKDRAQVAHLTSTGHGFSR